MTAVWPLLFPSMSQNYNAGWGKCIIHTRTSRCLAKWSGLSDPPGLLQSCRHRTRFPPLPKAEGAQVLSSPSNLDNDPSPTGPTSIPLSSPSLGAGSVPEVGGAPRSTVGAVVPGWVPHPGGPEDQTPAPRSLRAGASPSQASSPVPWT